MLVVAELLALSAAIAGVALVSIPAALISGGLAVLLLCEYVQHRAESGEPE